MELRCWSTSVYGWLNAGSTHVSVTNTGPPGVADVQFGGAADAGDVETIGSKQAPSVAATITFTKTSPRRPTAVAPFMTPQSRPRRCPLILGQPSFTFVKHATCSRHV